MELIPKTSGSLFESKPKKEVLDLSQNLLDNLDQVREYFSANIKYLILNLNQIQNLDSVVINSMKGLNGLLINYNKISDLSGIENLNDIRILDISNNLIKNIDKISQCYFLETLYASKNFIENPFPNLSQNSFPNLHILDLSSNQIKNIKFLKFLPHLQELYIRNCFISSLEGLDNLRYLKRLAISGNQLTDFPKLNLPSIEELDISRNEIENVSNIQYLIQLQSFDCSSNPIKEQSFHFGKELLDLIKINCSHTNISKPIVLLSVFPSLQYLDISYSQIQEEDEILSFIFSATHLSSIDFRFNPFNHSLYIMDKKFKSNDTFPSLESYINSIQNRIQPQIKESFINELKSYRLNILRGCPSEILVLDHIQVTKTEYQKPVAISGTSFSLHKSFSNSKNVINTEDTQSNIILPSNQDTNSEISPIKERSSNHINLISDPTDHSTSIIETCKKVSQFLNNCNESNEKSQEKILSINEPSSQKKIEIPQTHLLSQEIQTEMTPEEKEKRKRKNKQHQEIEKLMNENQKLVAKIESAQLNIKKVEEKKHHKNNFNQPRRSSHSTMETQKHISHQDNIKLKHSHLNHNREEMDGNKKNQKKIVQKPSFKNLEDLHLEITDRHQYKHVVRLLEQLIAENEHLKNEMAQKQAQNTDSQNTETSSTKKISQEKQTKITNLPPSPFCVENIDIKSLHHCERMLLLNCRTPIFGNEPNEVRPDSNIGSYLAFWISHVILEPISLQSIKKLYKYEEFLTKEKGSNLNLAFYFPEWRKNEAKKIATIYRSNVTFSQERPHSIIIGVFNYGVSKLFDKSPSRQQILNFFQQGIHSIISKSNGIESIFIPFDDFFPLYSGKFVC